MGKCPACSAPVGLSAVLCVACGFDFRRGRRLQSTQATSSGCGKNTLDAGSSLVDRLKLVGLLILVPALLIGAIVGLVRLQPFGKAWIYWTIEREKDRDPVVTVVIHNTPEGDVRIQVETERGYAGSVKKGNVSIYWIGIGIDRVYYDHNLIKMK